MQAKKRATHSPGRHRQVGRWRVGPDKKAGTPRFDGTGAAGDVNRRLATASVDGKEPVERAANRPCIYSKVARILFVDDLNTIAEIADDVRLRVRRADDAALTAVSPLPSLVTLSPP